MTVATASGVTAARCRCTTPSSTERPSATSASTAPASSCHSRRSPGSPSTTDPTVIAWSSFSTTQALHPESHRIHCTCSADDVG